MEDWFDPLDFSGISRYPNRFLNPHWDKHIPKFHGHNDLVALHVTSFIELISIFNCFNKTTLLNKKYGY